MQINSISQTNQSFSGYFGVLKDVNKYTPVQRNAVARLRKFLFSDEGEKVLKDFEELGNWDTCFLLKPCKKGKRITMQAVENEYNAATNGHDVYEYQIKSRAVTGKNPLKTLSDFLDKAYPILEIGNFSRGNISLKKVANHPEIKHIDWNELWGICRTEWRH